jgi:hypothetical protein
MVCGLLFVVCCSFESQILIIFRLAEFITHLPQYHKPQTTNQTSHYYNHHTPA